MSEVTFNDQELEALAEKMEEMAEKPRAPEAVDPDETNETPGGEGLPTEG